VSGVSINKKLNDFDRIASRFPDRVSVIIRKGSADIQRIGQKNTPIGPTGNLRNNVVNSYRPGSLSASIRWVMQYAAYVHEGTYKMPGRPFASDAVETVWPSVVEAFQSLEKDL
jgi:HK97 gp10 family phage protein